MDLGTTHSLVGVWRDGVELIPNALGEVLTPSVVSLDDSGTIVVGAAARERLGSHPDRTVAAFKRYMGTPRRLALGTQTFRAEELASFVIRALRADAEAWLGEPVTEAVVTVPAYFSDAQRRATRLAGELAGLKVERVLNEPTAAALAYGLSAGSVGQDGSVLVFDLGGGTFDVSVLDIHGGIVEVRASAGDNFLGGEDFDDALVAWFVAQTGLPAPGALDAGPQGLLLAAWLRRAAEAARRRLSTHDSATMAVQLPDGTRAEALLTAEAFAALAEPLLERLRRPIARALADSRIRPAELAQVVLAGGATRMPLVRKEAARLFGRLPLHGIDPDEVVARGAAVQAGLKMRAAALQDVVLTDVAPYTLGISVMEPGGGSSDGDTGRMLPVIERNTVVPASRLRSVVPAQDFQRQVQVRIYQGESRLVRDNIALGSFSLALVPRRMQDQSIAVRFTYDIDGILEVSASSEADGTSRRIVIRHGADAPEVHDTAERRAVLSALQLHPRDGAAHRLLLARAERLYEELLGAGRETLGQAIDRFDAALHAQDPEGVHDAARALATVLQRIEPGHPT
ncbi:Hsp70 family protein [Xylophilus sp. Leaf220]|uniref:Hsp70 family protein n=1 Tax=Xylophilus sp. Leaf220 TaxID=1735686 RepID=UPI0006F9ECEC|nr:Hsp70 family protein [Xylophilus sp. Leaf220]KQM70140.1 2-alkenal reductase [Xylophilus sp. Leaf220]